jgi:hypothetical protein
MDNNKILPQYLMRERVTEKQKKKISLWNWNLFKLLKQTRIYKCNMFLRPQYAIQKIAGLRMTIVFVKFITVGDRGFQK